MATIEENVQLQVKAENGDVRELYPITRAENVIGLEGSGGEVDWDISPVRIGLNSVANATQFLEATAIGVDATANGGGTLAVGLNASAGDLLATALGMDTNAAGNQATALGYRASVTANYGTALGSQCSVGGESGFAAGSASNCNGDFSVALGHGATGGATDCVAIGRIAAAANTGAIAIGSGSNAIAHNTVSVGVRAGANTIYAVALGDNTRANGRGSVAVGASSNAIGSYCISAGYNAQTSGDYGVAIGYNARSSASAISAGRSAGAYGVNSLCLGDSGYTGGEKSAAIGYGTMSNGTQSTALGASATALGNNSTALGTGAAVPATDENTMQLGGGDLSSLRSATYLAVTSDERDKAEIAPVKKGLSFLRKVQPIQYVRNPRAAYLPDEDSRTDRQQELLEQYGLCDCYDEEAHAAGERKGGRKRVGVSAQQVQEALETVYGTADYANLVNDNLHDARERGELPEGVESQLTVSYSGFVPFLIQAVQELSDTVDAQQDEIRKLKRSLQ